MRYHYERQRSTAAFWSYRLSVFLIPYFIVVIFGHRAAWIPTSALFVLLGLGFALALVSLGFGLFGLRQLWVKGHEGGIKATWGVLIALFALLPAAYLGLKAYRAPPLFDIVTDAEDAPEYEALAEDNARSIKPLAAFSPQMVSTMRSAYPRVSSRRYRATADRVFAEALAITESWGWQVVDDTPPEIIDLVDSDLRISPDNPLAVNPDDPADIVPKSKPERPADDGVTESAGDDAPSGNISDLIASSESQEEKETELAGNTPAEASEGYIEAISFSRVLKVRNDVIIRVVQEDETSLVDMRSTSRWQSHDLGENARIIEAFLEELDDSLAGVAGKEE